MMTNKFQYNAMDNILGITNAVDPTRGNTNGDKKLGGAFKHSYAYDDLNRLVYASGKAKQASYSMQMTFGRMSEPLTKVQKVDSTKTALSYGFTYKYEDSNHPTAPSQIGHEHYTYDANGNPTLVENDSLGTERRMYWDEDNRLMVLSDNGKTSRYTYNAAGERIIKSHGDLEGVYINGAPQGMTFHETEDYTIYPAPIITVTKNRFTKHYFIGDKRVASKLGVGKFSNVYGIGGNNVTAGQKDYAARMMQIEKQREEYYKSLGTPPGVPTMKGATADPDNTGRGYNDIIGDLGDHSVPEGWVQRPKFSQPGTPPGPPVQWNPPTNPEDVPAGYGYVASDTTREETFFYHSDHLGSTGYITDKDANITQFDAYLPYGELLVDEHSSSEDMPYKFNGKELDEETGLYYYGARYLNPVTSLWYGVDPLAEKYVTTGGYVYTLDNPVKLVDTDGRKVYIFTETKGTGHTFVAIADSKGITVYTYGRYGDGLGPVGDGVLVRYNGDKAKNYIKSELYRMEAKAFQIKDASDSKVRNYFDSKYNVSSTGPDTNNPNVKKYGKVIDEYNLLNNNCTTMSSDAIKAGGSTVFDVKGTFSNYDEDFVIPSSLQKYLEKSSKDNKNVNDATDRLKTYYSQAKKIERINGVGSSGSSSGAMGTSSGSSANTSSSDTSSSGSGSGAFGSSFNSSY